MRDYVGAMAHWEAAERPLGIVFPRRLATVALLSMLTLALALFGAASARGDALFVADRDAAGGSGGVIRVNPQTGAQTVVASGGAFVDPTGIALTPTGDLLV